MKHLLISVLLLLTLFCAKKVFSQRVWFQEDISWTAVGDNGMTGGPASGYELRLTRDTTENFNDWSIVPNMPTPLPPGDTMTIAFADSLWPGQTYYFAVIAWDDWFPPNVSPRSNIIGIYIPTPDVIPPATIFDLRWGQ